MGLKALLAVKPGISPENLVRALAGQSHLIVFLYHGTELKHGGIDVPHGGQIVGQHRVIEPVRLGEIVAFQIVVAAAQKFHHFVHKGTVLGGLEGVGLKIAVIVHEIKGKGVEPLPALL